MSIQMLTIFILNFIIALIGTLAYSTRLVGVRTGRVAISFALFSVLSLVSRTALGFQVPLLTKYTEVNANGSLVFHILVQIILISGAATIFGAFLIPTFQRVFCKGVLAFSIERSVPKLILHSFSKSGIRYIRECAAMPAKDNVTGFRLKNLPVNLLAYNMLSVALITVGTIAPIYAAAIEPDLRATCIALSPVINGLGTILMSIFIDPPLSVMTDDVIDGKCTHEEFRACVVGMVYSKTAGTFLSVFLLIPAAYLVVAVARIL